MESQNKLEIGIGTAETESKLNPKPVKVMKVSTELVTFGEKQWDVVVFSVKHPDKEELIDLKKVKYEKDNKIKVVGTSLSLDKDGNINKNSALAYLLSFYKASKPLEMKDKEVQTSLDDKDYLCLKAY